MTKIQETEIQPKSFDVIGCAKYTGLKERTVRDYVFKRAIPYFKLNKKVMFKKTSIDEWINSFTEFKTVEGAE